MWSSLDAEDRVLSVNGKDTVPEMARCLSIVMGTFTESSTNVRECLSAMIHARNALMWTGIEAFARLIALLAV